MNKILIGLGITAGVAISGWALFGYAQNQGLIFTASQLQKLQNHEKQKNKPSVEELLVNTGESLKLDLSSLEYKEVVDPKIITVNGDSITIENTLKIGSFIEDISLDKATGTFDTIETIKLSELEGYTMIYSIPSLDTPVCTKQTKQIEFAGKAFPSINFVTISHDMPFALKRFCGENNIDNILTLSDSRSKQFAQKNGLFMKEYGLMTRAVLIIDNKGEVEYIDYADEVTQDVDLLNAFAFLKSIKNL